MTARLAALVLALAAWTQVAVPQSRAADDPGVVLGQLTEKLNAHDGAGAAALFSDDGVFTDLSGTSFGAVGVPAITYVFAGAAGDPEFNITDAGSVVSGDTVTGVVDIHDSLAVGAGVERYVQPYTATVSGGKITGLHLTYDESDEQTHTYLKYSGSLPGDNGPPPADLLDISMAGTQGGTAALSTQADGVVSVAINIAEGPYAVLQQAHIFSGSCGSLGDVASALAPFVYGNSYTYVSAALQDLIAGSHAVVVAAAPGDNRIVSCGNIELAPTPTSTPVPPAATPVPLTATPGPQLPITGGGGSGGGSAFAWLIGALVASGAAAFAGYGALRLRGMA